MEWDWAVNPEVRGLSLALGEDDKKGRNFERGDSLADIFQTAVSVFEKIHRSCTPLSLETQQRKIHREENRRDGSEKPMNGGTSDFSKKFRRTV
eukprot:scaffold77638_cov23-Cyclotella_meneghiniana.AAC.1